ncbi:MAG: ATP-binding cassette domain-containing protein [Chlamydiales bacterium]|nr:ATP-binding cassette domain-containing protein [Chlamydiia bacterium]MCP5507611.1 ATP-binding cassette domain-containing protein [Chlamydiales bacterium]
MTIVVSELSKQYTHVLFENVSVAFNPGEKVGLTGPNGAGKTTFMRILMGDEEPTSGSKTIPDRIGILRQNIEAFRDHTVIDAVIMGNARLWSAMQERDSLYEVEMTDDVGMRLGELEGIIAEEDGYSAESQAEVLLTGIGIDEEYLHLKLGNIPNDLQFRVLLCQALFGEPQALLLDEPTNHLDLESITWLEDFLHNYNGTLIVISHDRHFLNSVCTQIADIDYETIIMYPGNYDDMIAAKTAVRSRAEQDAKAKEKKIAQLKEFVARFSAGSRASQVQSRVKQMDRLKPQDLKESNIQRPYIRFQSPEVQPGKIVLTAQHLYKSYDDNDVIKDFSIEIHRGDKIAVIGNNGRGKTTLLKMLAGVLEPDAGNVEKGHNAIISYFAQNHHDNIDKGKKGNCFDWLKEQKPDAYDQDIRGVMGKMLFSGDDAFKAVSTLSGGETARLIIAKMMLTDHNVLIMDEPNNHLDLEAVCALGWGLNDYKGTVVFASHDRDLINAVATKLIIFEANGIHIFDGNLEDYLSKKAQV